MAVSNVDHPALEQKSVTFELAMKELQLIVSQLDAGQLSLADSLACFERGTNLLRQCQQELDAAERKIEILTGFNAEGEPVTEPFAVSEAHEVKDQKAGRKRYTGKKHETTSKTHQPAETDDQQREKKLFF